MKKYNITKEEYKEAKNLSKANKNKNIDKRLSVIIMRYEGLKDREIAEKTGYHRKRISQLCEEFRRVGAEEYARMKYGGNHRSLTEEEEAEILSGVKEKAEKGQIITIREIKAAFDKKRGKDTGRSYIYTVLARHKWRKVMPRSKHPNKASNEVIEVSKKLTIL